MTPSDSRRAAPHASRRARRLALLLGSLLVVALPGTARAHGALRRSVPASGAHLAAAPRELRLTFSERVELAVARIALLGPASDTVALSPVRTGATPAEIVADVAGPLAAGTYTVAWQIAGRDGHPVRGRFRFTIAPGATGVAAAAPAATDPGVRSDPASADTAEHAAHAAGAPATAPHHDPTAMPTGGEFDAGSPLFAAARWLAFAATLALVGAVAFAMVVVPRARQTGAPAATLDASAARARTLGVAAAGTLLVASLLRLAAQSVAMHGAAGAADPGLVGTMLTGTSWGTGWLVQVAATIVALGALLSVRRGAGAWNVAAVAVLAVAVGTSLSGHAAAVPDNAALAVASDAAHVLGAGGWLGTLLALVVIGIPSALRAEPGERGPAAAALVNAFSPLALACAAALAVTGLAAAWWHVGSPGALWTSAYGRTLLLKLGVLALVAGTGAYNWRRVRPALRDERGVHRLRRSATVELLVTAVVLAVTAVLVATPTPMDALR